MILRYLLLISLCFFNTAGAQKHIVKVPDSLKNKDFDYLFDRIEDDSITSNKRSLYLKTFLLKAKTENNWEELSNAYKNYVHYAADSKKLIYADSMVWAAKRSYDNEIIVAAYLSKGVAYYGQKRLKEAMDIYLIADSYVKKTKNEYLAYKTKYLIGQMKFYLGFYQEAIAIFKDCISYFKGSDVRAYLNSLHSLGVCYNMLGDHGLSSAVNEKGIAEGITMGNREMESYFIHSEGINQCRIHNYETAIKKIRISLPAIHQNNDFSNETVGNFYIGKCYWELGEKEKALAYFRKVEKSYNERDYIRPDIREAYEYMISYYKEKDMIRPHLYYVEKLLEVDKKLHHTYTYLQGKIVKEYDTQQLMQDQKKLKTLLSLQRYNNKISYIVFTIMFLIIIFGIVKYFRNKKEARQKYEELLLKIKQSDNAKIVKADETEFSMSKDAEAAVLLNLQKFEKSKKFLDPDLNLTKLAGYFNTNTKYLSQIIAKHRDQKFNDYINCLKVEYIAQRIRDEKTLRNYTHDSLAEEAGFSSTRRFVKAFTSCTKITPKYFIEELKKEEGS